MKKQIEIIWQGKAYPENIEAELYEALANEKSINEILTEKNELLTEQKYHLKKQVEILKDISKAKDTIIESKDSLLLSGIKIQFS
jgi:hypothetical protein